MMLTETRRLELRARDAVSRCLLQRLTVPSIYFDAAWPTAGKRVDILAIDRAGAGDVHVVEVKHQAGEILAAIPSVLQIPAQYRWLAYFKDTLDALTSGTIRQFLFPPDEMGRVGLIEIVKTGDDDLEAAIAVRAERFRGSYRQQVAAFASAHEADIQFE